ncbi:MAG: nicotinate-nucleotide--dimethylbenzimidazole phosphoribosyltransferase [bacterium]
MQKFVSVQDIDQKVIEKAQTKLDNLTKPLGSLGRLEELAKKICGITGSLHPSMADKVIFTLAGDHGVTAEMVSAYPKEVTAQMIYNFLNGGAGINVLAKHVGARVVVVDMGVASDLDHIENLYIKKVGYGTKNMSKGPAMTRQEAIQSIQMGIEVFNEEYCKGIHLAGTGDMGIGNTTPSAAIAAVCTGAPVEDVTGRGTGIEDAALRNKIEVIKKAIAINKPDPKDAIDVLSKAGGFEIGGLAGIILAAAEKRVPVVLDGFISGTAALIACHIEPKIKEYLIAAHCSVEKGHKIILDHIGIKPVLDLNLRLGEGTGAALAMSIVEASIKILTQMATFETAHVSEKKA